jgi:hypothetical protein
MKPTEILIQATILLLTMVSLLQFFFSYTIAQPEITFTTTDKFEIHANNSSISFGFHGTYTKAYFEDNMWNFENLRSINSKETEKYNLKVSATDSHINITSYRIYNRVYVGENTTRARLVYRVNGYGTQTFILELDPSNGAFGVVIDGIFESLNHGWKLSPEGNPIVTGAKEYASVSYYGYPPSYINRTDGLEEHYVILTSTVFVAIIIFFTALITIRKNQKLSLKTGATNYGLGK